MTSRGRQTKSLGVVVPSCLDCPDIIGLPPNSPPLPVASLATVIPRARDLSAGAAKSIPTAVAKPEGGDRTGGVDGESVSALCVHSYSDGTCGRKRRRYGTDAGTLPYRQRGRGVSPFGGAGFLSSARPREMDPCPPRRGPEEPAHAMQGESGGAREGLVRCFPVDVSRNRQAVGRNEVTRKVTAAPCRPLSALVLA